MAKIFYALESCIFVINVYCLYNNVYSLLLLLLLQYARMLQYDMVYLYIYYWFMYLIKLFFLKNSG
jgi:hypothetical protein